MLNAQSQSLVKFWRAELRNKCSSAGICPRCMKDYVADGDIVCECCASKRACKRETTAARRLARKEAGVCPQCGRELEPGRVVCQKCSDIMNASKKRLYLRRKAAHICVHCGKAPALPDQVFCSECKLKVNG